MSFFTGLWGSLIHPTAMIILIPAWIVAMVLGIRVRRKRLSLQSNGEATGLLSGTVATNKRHHRLAAGTYFLTVVACFTGMGNTYLRAGRLFPGPHLFSGLAVLLVGSLSVALVPWFSEYPSVRLPHTIAGFIIILLLAVQVRTGLTILSSVWRDFH